MTRKNQQNHYDIKVLSGYGYSVSVKNQRIVLKNGTDIFTEKAEIGKIRPFTREVNLNADRKRLWLGIIKSVSNNQYNDSVSISLNQFKKEQI